jgi:hypothetical protein
MKLALPKIRLNGGTQPREKLDHTTVIQYKQDMRAGVQYDPIEVVYDGTDYWCWDGFHRCAAASLAGLLEIEAHVTQGSLEDALWLSASANKRHGVPRSNADKGRAVRTALNHPQGAGLSDHKIAEHVGVSQPFVGKIRRKMAATNNGYHSATRTGRDGRTIKTANIGRTPHSPPRQSGGRASRPMISPKAHMPRLGHSAPCPMIPLQLSPNNPQTAAATLWQHFSRSFIETLIAELTQRLTKQGAVA